MKGGKLFMKFGTEKMGQIIENIISEKLPHQDNVIIGENSSGKSLLLKEFIEKIGIGREIYFIDAVNRSFDVKKVINSHSRLENKATVLENRLKDMYFNLQDTFSCYGTQTECIEMIYYRYEEKIQSLFFKLTGDKFTILLDSISGEVNFGNGQGLLSSGYQAIVRILIELLYYQDVLMPDEKSKKYWLVIDEIDEFLSPRYSAEIFEFLKREFPWGRWLIATHSCDLIANTKDANLIMLYDTEYEVRDIDDYSSVSEVQIIFRRLFDRQVILDHETDNILRRLFNNKISNAWSDSDETCLNELADTRLSASQRVILRQIQEW